MEPLNATGTETMSSGMEYAINYYRWLFDLCKDYIGDTIIDVGSGFGSYIGFFKNKKVIAVDISPEVIQKIQKEYKSFPNITAICSDICDTEFIRKTIYFSVETVICFNVLEHLKDDIVALKNIYQILKHGQGNLIIVAPANPLLYGEMDRLAGHYRRYSKKELETKLTEQGFQFIKSFYFNSLGFFGWFLTNKVFRPRNLSTSIINFQIAFYNKIIPIIKKLDKILNLPFGQSLFVVAKAI